MNNNQGQHIQNNTQPHAVWPQGIPQHHQQQLNQLTPQQLRFLHSLQNNQLRRAVLQSGTQSNNNSNDNIRTSSNINGASNSNNAGSFSIPFSLALPTTSVQSPNRTNIVQKPVQSTLNQHFSVVSLNNSQQQQQQDQQQQTFMTSPTVTATPASIPLYAAATRQQQPTGVNNISMAPVTPPSTVMANLFQGNNNNDNNNATVGSSSSIGIPSQVTSPITPTTQNHLLADDLLNKRQEDLLKLLGQIQPQRQRQISDNNSLPQSPISSPQQQRLPLQQQQNPRSNSNNSDTNITNRNNLRLNQLEKEISSSAMYGPACDEFLEWLQDVRAYNPGNESALMKCANAVRNNFQVGPWSGMRIFDTIHKFISHLSGSSQTQIIQWRDEIRLATIGEAPTTTNTPATTTITTSSSISSASQTSSPVASNFANVPIHRQQSEGTIPSQQQETSPHQDRQLPITSPQQSIHLAPSHPNNSNNYNNNQQQGVPMPLPNTTPTSAIIPSHPSQQYMFQLPHYPYSAPHPPPQQQIQHIPPQPYTHQQIEQILWDAQQTQMPNNNGYPSNNPMVASPSLPLSLPPSSAAPGPGSPVIHNPLPFIRKIGYAVNPFRLKHNQKITRVPFFMDGDRFPRVWKGIPQTAGALVIDPTRLPLSYVLTAWRDKTTEDKCEWPDTIKMSLNRTIPNLTKRRKVRVQGRPDAFTFQGKDKALDTGGYLHLGRNELAIEQLDCACSYFFAIIVFIRESEEIISQGVQSRVLDINKGRAIVNRLLGNTESDADDDDIQIHQTNVKIGLKCPISLQRIKLPTKGEACKHPDCFDLSSYLAVNHENTSWKCPHCNEYTPPNKLYRDAFFEDLLERVNKAAVEVEFAENASNFRVIRSETPDPDDDQRENLGYGDLDNKNNSDENQSMEPSMATKKEELAEEQQRNVISLLSDDEEEEDNGDEEQRNRENDNNQQTAEEQENSNNSRKRTGDIVDSIQTAQSESSVEKSPTTPGNVIVNNKRPRTSGEQQEEEPFQSRFAPMDPNDVLSLMTFGSTGNNNKSDNLNSNSSDLL
ncbi:hypothetical protein BDC45DRAFT_607599 [Circinella umbellata]|nr:hypothetical protein BDC45DRAFT_607599 [Circinella umbellata]